MKLLGHRPRRHYLSVFAAVMASLGTSARAAEVFWTNPPGTDGQWTTSPNWTSNPALPGSSDNAHIAGTLAVTVQVQHASGTHVVNSHSVGPYATLTNTGGQLRAIASMTADRGGLVVSGGTVVVATSVPVGLPGPGVYLGVGNAATSLASVVIQNAGSFANSAGPTYIGYSAAGASVASIADTGSSWTDQSMVVGRDAVGFFFQLQGQHTVQSTLTLGQTTTSTGNGSYQMDDGLLDTQTTAVGANGVGSFLQALGDHTASTALVIGQNVGGNGTYRLTGAGSVTTADLTVGAAGVAIMQQLAGTVTTTNLRLTTVSGGSGRYELGGGKLTVTAAATVGAAGRAELFQTGGEFKANSLTVKNNSLVDVSGGTLTVPSLTNSAQTTVRAGAAFVGQTAVNTGALTLAGTQQWGAGATLQQLGGSLLLASDAGGPAGDFHLSLSVQGGSAAFASPQHLAALTIGAGQTARVAADGKSVLQTQSLVFDGAGPTLGRLDLANNDLVLHYTGAAPYEWVRDMILLGRSAAPTGLWTSLPNPAGLEAELVPVDNNQLHLLAWDGQTITDGSTFNQVLAIYTLRGDVNLDYRVDDADLYNIVANLGRPGSYFDGDVNLDGLVTLADLGIVAARLGTELPTGLYASTMVGVPEPGSLMLTALGALLLGRRRRGVAGSCSESRLGLASPRGL